MKDALRSLTTTAAQAIAAAIIASLSRPLAVAAIAFAHEVCPEAAKAEMERRRTIFQRGEVHVEV